MDKNQNVFPRFRRESFSEVLMGRADRRRPEAIPGLTCIWQVKGREDIPFD